mmetsp:Transcript_10226/g.32994  ORF Transcript_10226/g.32994 Transcript_10226/m.32994 type:complete len:233 (-) Transcript_10226:648-1346(-)
MAPLNASHTSTTSSARSWRRDWPSLVSTRHTFQLRPVVAAATLRSEHFWAFPRRPLAGGTVAVLTARAGVRATGGFSRHASQPDRPTPVLPRCPNHSSLLGRRSTPHIPEPGTSARRCWITPARPCCRTLRAISRISRMEGRRTRTCPSTTWTKRWSSSHWARPASPSLPFPFSESCRWTSCLRIARSMADPRFLLLSECNRSTHRQAPSPSTRPGITTPFPPSGAHPPSTL